MDLLCLWEIRDSSLNNVAAWMHLQPESQMDLFTFTPAPSKEGPCVSPMQLAQTQTTML